jgi:DNA-binding MarR family transcriptional regulator
MLSNAIDQELAPYELTHQQFSILVILSQLKCQTAADLARETCGDTGAITRMLDRLEAKDMIRRVRSVEDRRVVNIELTSAGALCAEKMPVVAINVINRHLDGFNKQELETMKMFMRRLLNNGGVGIPGDNT